MREATDGFGKSRRVSRALRGGGVRFEGGSRGVSE